MLAKPTIKTSQATIDVSRLLGFQKPKTHGPHYLLVGGIKGAGGWAINISIIKSQIPRAFKILIPRIVKEQVAFKIIRDLEAAEVILSAAAGYHHVGRIICIFPENAERADQLARLMIELTAEFQGPSIPTDVHLGGCVYTSYGSFEEIDKYPIPFEVPKGIPWPFAGLKPQDARQSNILYGAYLLRALLKSDAKGRVWKGLWIKGLKFKPVVIKEGRHDMFTDTVGRDVQQRLAWQYKLLKELEGKVPVPKAYELFSENGNTYISMERIKGVSLSDAINTVHNYRPWRRLSVDEKCKLLNYFLKTLDITAMLHNAGIIHRDLSPANFMVTKNDSVVLIDLELAYSCKTKTPSPAFESGINGFTAPERSYTSTPSAAEDIYSMGAIAAVLFTNIYPAKGFQNTSEQTANNISGLICDKIVCSLLMRCLAPNPVDRPSLPEVIAFFQTYYKNVKSRLNIPQSKYIVLQDRQVIESGIKTLVTPLMLDSRRLWATTNSATNAISGSEFRSKEVTPNLFAGMSGVAYFLSVAKNNEYSTKQIEKIWEENCRYILEEFKRKHPVEDTSLYSGKTGMLLGLRKTAQSGLIRISQDSLEPMLNENGDGTVRSRISDGLAGKGLALLGLLEAPGNAKLDNALAKLTTSIVEKQHRKGFWNDSDNIFTGFSNGTAGIAIFLFEHYLRYREEKALSSALKALDYLIASSKKQRSGPVWLVSQRDQRIDPWFSEGITGIALAFLKGYQATKNGKYAETAAAILKSHPPELATNNLSLANGAAGIGEAYLEAYNILTEKEWLRRAEDIRGLILNSVYEQNTGVKYWIVENNRPPSAGLMEGQSGILHFLLRAEDPKKISFPLLTLQQ